MKWDRARTREHVYKFKFNFPAQNVERSTVSENRPTASLYGMYLLRTACTLHEQHGINACLTDQVARSGDVLRRT